jgi:integrase
MGDRIKLTKRHLDWARAHPTTKDDVHWDTELSRFGLRQKGTRRSDGTPGALSYVVQYRNREGVSRRYTIGNANAITPEEARRMARSLLARIDDPRERYDPAADKSEAREAPTFGELVDAYLTSDGWQNKAPGTQAVERGLIAHHLLPLLGKRLAREVTRRDMEKAFRDIRDGKTATDKPSGKPRGRIRVTGGIGTARRTLQLASPIFAHGLHQGTIPSNPCVGLKLGSSGTRETIVEDETEYARLFRALAELESEKAVTQPTADALRIIALTGARRGEILNLRGRHLDLMRQRIVLAPHEHKAGHRTGRPKVISLPAAAAAILAATIAEGIKPDDLVFKSSKAGSPISLKKPWAKVRARAGLPPGLTIHGLRHSIGSHLAMTGASGLEIQAVLGHANIATSVRYIHFAEGRKNALAERAAAAAVAGLESAKLSGESAAVIPLRPTAG